MLKIDNLLQALKGKGQEIRCNGKATMCDTEHAGLFLQMKDMTIYRKGSNKSGIQGAASWCSASFVYLAIVSTIMASKKKHTRRPRHTNNTNQSNIVSNLISFIQELVVQQVLCICNQPLHPSLQPTTQSANPHHQKWASWLAQESYYWPRTSRLLTCFQLLSSAQLVVHWFNQCCDIVQSQLVNLGGFWTKILH